jgi:1,4-alpha-glucan branching enzyme
MENVLQIDWFTEFDFYLFGEGKHYRIYEKLGAHSIE